MVQSVQLKRGQTHGQGSGPILHTSRRTISHFCDTLKMWNSVGIKSTRILWYLWNWGNQVFCEIFCTNTYTLRLVSPLGCPGNPAYPTAQRGYPMAREHTLLPNTLPSTQQTIIQPREAALQPTDFRSCPMALRPPFGQETTPTVSQHTLASGTGIPMVPSIHSLQERPQGPHRLQDCIASQQRA